MKTRLIKKYQNRKLYDTEKSCYINLSEIVEFVREDLEFVVMDNVSKRDITHKIVLEAVYRGELDSLTIPLQMLKGILKSPERSIESYVHERAVQYLEVAEKIQKTAKALKEQLTVVSGILNNGI